jgi:hypothetical protein
MSGVTAHERDQERVKHSHGDDASDDCGNSKEHIFGLHESKAAQKRWDCREDARPMRLHRFAARLALDHTPGTERGLAPKTHGSTIAVRTFDHWRDA